eukprot:3637305-Rhodomonas_salina.3
MPGTAIRYASARCARCGTEIGYQHNEVRVDNNALRGGVTVLRSGIESGTLYERCFTEPAHGNARQTTT